MIGSSTPTITCVVVTKGRVSMLVKAINCYLSQTYKNKNMVIVSQGTAAQNQAIKSHLRLLNREDIEFYEAHSTSTLGMMRNTSVELAKGQIICQWDDDDLYHPDRLATQYNALRVDSSVVASLYCAFLKYYSATRELYWCDWSGEPIPSHRYLCGSIMFRKELFHCYSTFYPQTGSQSAVEEDLNVLQKLHEKGEISGLWEAWHYVYVFHGGNVYDFNHHNYTLDIKTGKKVLSKEELLSKQVLLEKSFDVIELDEDVVVRSKEEPAFVYKPITEDGS